MSSLGVQIKSPTESLANVPAMECLQHMHTTRMLCEACHVQDVAIQAEENLLGTILATLLIELLLCVAGQLCSQAHISM